MSEPRSRRGRHSRPDGDATGPAGRVRSPAISRRAYAVLGSVAGLGFAAATVLLPGGSGRAPGAAAVRVPERRPARTPTTRETRRIREAGALEYYRTRDRAQAGHVKRVMLTGPILRVYTDLPESAADSHAAITLCRTAADYLRSLGRAPMVFVHANRRDGYPVLANKTGARDSCRLNGVP